MAVEMNPVNVKKESNPTPSFLALKDGRKIAYHLTEGSLPCVIFMGGFKSDMTGAKALALEAFCKGRGKRFIRFDYTGHGQSSGNFRDGTIGSWRQDVLDVLGHLAADQNILVGSSMGGWLMLLTALTKPQSITGLLGIASAPDFTETLVWNQMTAEQKQTMSEKGEILIPFCYGEEPYPITARLIEEGRKHMLLDKTIGINVPVRLIHGLKDEDVPWQTSVVLSEKLASADVKISLVKEGGHRMSEPEHLALLCNTLAGMLDANCNM